MTRTTIITLVTALTIAVCIANLSPQAIAEPIPGSGDSGALSKAPAQPQELTDAAALFKKITARGGPMLPFYMEMPPYQVPRLRNVGAEVWTATSAFLRKVTSIILATTVVLWVLLNLPMRSEAEMSRIGFDFVDELSSIGVPLPHELRVADKGIEVRKLLRPELLPKPPVTPKRWHATFCRNTRARENTD